MPKFFIISKEEHHHDYYEDFESRAGHREYFFPNGVYEAGSRSKAKYLFCKEHKLELTEGVEIKRIKSCDYCRNTGTITGELGEPCNCPECHGLSVYMENK